MFLHFLFSLYLLHGTSQIAIRTIFLDFTLFLGGTHKNVVLHIKQSAPLHAEVLSGGVTSV